MSRWQAGFIHLLISIFIVSLVAAYVIYFWYPLPLLPMANGDKLLMLIGGIDIVVGPLLTLIVYKVGKKTLKMDLTVIALLQASFLSFGLYTIFESRPVYLVATSHMMDLVFANEILTEDIKQAHADYQQFSFTHPHLVGAAMPKDAKEISRITLSSLNGGNDLQQMPQHYVDFKIIAPTLLNNAIRLEKTSRLTEEKVQKLTLAAQGYGYQANQVRAVILGSSRGVATMLIDAKTGQPIGAVDVKL